MDSVSSIAATQVALTQARVQAEIAARLLKVAQRVGSPQQMLELVRSAAETAAQLLQRQATPPGGLDLYA